MKEERKIGSEKQPLLSESACQLLIYEILTIISANSTYDFLVGQFETTNSGFFKTFETQKESFVKYESIKNHQVKVLLIM